jgi:PIN domain nuclease of toxin-antitoxin system
MRLLLDTHALYWYTAGDSKLSIQAQTVIQDATNDVFLSPASLWEIAVKVSNGKWKMNQTFEVFLDRCLNQYEFKILPIQPSHTIAVSRLPFPTDHRDPFDRMLISQAIAEIMALVSVDSAFDPYGVTRIW